MDQPGNPGDREPTMRSCHAAFSRRLLLALPLAGVAHERGVGGRAALASEVQREQIAAIERVRDLAPPLTLGMARVVLRPGALAPAAIPQGARMIAVESGVLAVSVAASANEPLSSRALSSQAVEPDLSDELFVPAGTAITFGSRGVTIVRNPGVRSVVALDVVVYREEPRPMARAFTTEDGVSFELLASASAAEAPAGRVAITLERVRLSQLADLPADLSAGLVLARVDAGTIHVRPAIGDIFVAQAAASAPYSMPESLEPIAAGAMREVTAGGVIFQQVGALATITNPMRRAADLMMLTVRDAD
jgi:hypothetical protein